KLKRNKTKKENIIYTSILRCKVCDFGTCRKISNTQLSGIPKYTSFGSNNTNLNILDDELMDTTNLSNQNKNLSEIKKQSHTFNQLSNIHNVTESSQNYLNLPSKQKFAMTLTGIGTVAYLAPELIRYIDFSSKLNPVHITDKVEYTF